MPRLYVAGRRIPVSPGFAITVVEMVTAAQQYGARNFQYLEPITLAGVIFLLASYPTSILIRRLEKSLAY